MRWCYGMDKKALADLLRAASTGWLYLSTSARSALESEAAKGNLRLREAAVATYNVCRARSELAYRYAQRLENEP